MCHINNSANNFHIPEHLYDEENEEGEELTNAACHVTSPICFGDYLAIAEDRRGSHWEKAPGNKK
jgi:hypothetical protein